MYRTSLRKWYCTVKRRQCVYREQQTEKWRLDMESVYSRRKEGVYALESDEGGMRVLEYLLERRCVAEGVMGVAMRRGSVMVRKQRSS